MKDSFLPHNTRPVGGLFVVSAPSGTGKTTITNFLQKQNIVRVAVSYTTRAPRRGEKNGEQYFFIDQAEFMRMRDCGEFLEWAEVFGNFYGTARRWVEQQLAANTRLVLELDVQGALQVKKQIPAATLIFIRPPSLQDLARRLRARAADSQQAIAFRLSRADSEMQEAQKYDHVIINDNLRCAIAKTIDIIAAKDKNISAAAMTGDIIEHDKQC